MIVDIVRMPLVYAGQAIVEVLVRLVSVMINVQAMDRIIYKLYFILLAARRRGVSVQKASRAPSVSLGNFYLESSGRMVLWFVIWGG